MKQMLVALLAMLCYFWWLMALYQVDTRHALQKSLLSGQGLDGDAILEVATTEALWLWLLGFLQREIPATNEHSARYSRFPNTEVTN